MAVIVARDFMSSRYMFLIFFIIGLFYLFTYLMIETGGTSSEKLIAVSSSQSPNRGRSEFELIASQTTPRVGKPSVVTNHTVYQAITAYSRPSIELPTNKTLIRPVDERSFGVDEETLRTIKWPITRHIELTRRTLEDFVFVTAASADFYNRAADAIATVQKHFPGRKIIFYHINSNERDPDGIISGLCDVEYRRLNTEQLPSHVSVLSTYAWKPIIIHEVLQEHAGVFWIDASIRFTAGNLTEVFRFVERSGGAMMFNYCGHNTFSVTHEQMYKYLPTDLKQMQTILQYEANIMLLYRTAAIYNDVIKWWVLCALTKSCIAPTNRLFCNFTDADKYAGCHRFDQSAINILLANKFGFDYKRYAHFVIGLEVVKRFSSGEEHPKYCKNKQQH